MGIANAWLFSHVEIDWDKFAEATHNQYRVVSARPYVDKKGELPNGVNLTLQVVKDDFDYGVDKKGVPRENNLYQNFDVTVLNDRVSIKKGDLVQLLEFDPSHSYYINFNLILRFRDAKVLRPQQASAQVAPKANA